MRMILVDSARAALREKRGRGWVQVTLDEGMALTDSDEVLVEVDEALRRLSEQDARKASLVELHW